MLTEAARFGVERGGLLAEVVGFETDEVAQDGVRFFRRHLRGDTFIDLRAASPSTPAGTTIPDVVSGHSDAGRACPARLRHHAPRAAIGTGRVDARVCSPAFCPAIALDVSVHEQRQRVH